MTFAPLPYCVHVRSSHLVIRKRFEELNLPRKKKSLLQSKNEIHLLASKPSGVVTRKIRQRINRILEVWVKCIAYGDTDRRGKKKQLLTFTTLTLPAKQMHDDKDLNKALNRLLIKLKRMGAYKYYFWRAERQKNGNLHYHLVLDKYINWEVIRKEWNHILNDLGYIDAYRKEQQKKHANGFAFDVAAFKKSKGKSNQEKQYQAYLKGCAENWENPNSTDIHALKNIQDPAKYIAKYCAKDHKFQPGEDLESIKVKSRIWGCSDELKTLKEPVISEYEMNIQDFCDEVEASATKVKDEEAAKIIYSKQIRTIIKKYPRILKAVHDHYRTTYYRLYPSGFKQVNKTLFIVPGVTGKHIRKTHQALIDFEF